jgi:hypothetical protein
VASSATISLRLPQEVRERIDRAAAKSRRSRSYIMQRALELHLDALERGGDLPERQGRYDNLLSLQGAAIGPDGPRTKIEIDDYIRWLRDDDRIPE